jgi:hypothetical protein
MSTWGKFLSHNVHWLLRPLQDVVRRKCPEKWKYNIWFVLHDNAATHRSVLVKDCLVNNNVTTLEHPPYSPDLVYSCFLPFSSTVTSFCDATDIINNATGELKRVSENGFQESSQHIQCRWQKFTVAQRDYFEGRVAKIIVLLCIYQK